MYGKARVPFQAQLLGLGCVILGKLCLFLYENEDTTEVRAMEAGEALPIITLGIPTSGSHTASLAWLSWLPNWEQSLGAA